MAKNGPVSTRYMQPTDKITLLTRRNPYSATLATRFQLLLDGKCQTVEEYCATKLPGAGIKGNPNPRKGDLGWWVMKGSIKVG